MMHRIGATFFVIWGLLHLYAAYGLYLLGASMTPTIIEARIVQGAWHLLFFGAIAIVVGIRWNWNNSAMGYWINIVTLSVVDVGFIFIVLIPQQLPIFPAGLGPLFWVLAAIFSTVGYLKEARTA